MNRLRALLRDTRGVAVVETALVAPMLVMLSLGTYQVSMAVARQHELQAGADQAMAVAIGGWTNENAQVSALKSVIQRSTNVAEDKITLDRMYRCGSDANYVTDKSTCTETDIVAGYLKLEIKDTYTPTWAKYGVGKPINLSVTRMVQVS